MAEITRVEIKGLVDSFEKDGKSITYYRFYVPVLIDGQPEELTVRFENALAKRIIAKRLGLPAIEREDF